MASTYSMVKPQPPRCAVYAGHSGNIPVHFSTPFAAACFANPTPTVPIRAVAGPTVDREPDRRVIPGGLRIPLVRTHIPFFRFGTHDGRVRCLAVVQDALDDFYHLL